MQFYSHFNQLTPAQAERLAIIAEEAGEVAQAAMKILRHGYDMAHPDGGASNREKLTKEIGDLHAAAQIMLRAGDIILDDIREAVSEKLRSGGRWHHHQGEAA